MIPTEGSEESKRPATPPVPEAPDDETFEDRLRRALVRHFQFAWSELGQARRAEREKPESERSEAARPETAISADVAPPPPPAISAEAPQPPPPPPGISVDVTPQPPPGGNGSNPARSGESGPTLPPDRPPF